jgi:hypothetical protein
LARFLTFFNQTEFLQNTGEIKMRNSYKAGFFLILTLITFLFLSGCEKEESPTQSSSNLYSGSWQLVFAGDYIGSGNFSIDSEGKFAVNVLLYDGSGTFTNTIEGSVSSSGSMNADIYYSGSKIGTASGNFTSKSGNGSWSTNSTSGTWSATKQ